jgi:hypothetical protein
MVGLLRVDHTGVLTVILRSGPRLSVNRDRGLHPNTPEALIERRDRSKQYVDASGFICILEIEQY